MQIRQGKNRRYSGVSVPLFMGITGVNEHIKPFFDSVLLKYSSYAEVFFKY